MTEAARLYAEAEVRAERTVAALRIGIALLLGASFMATVAGTAPAGATAIARQFDETMDPADLGRFVSDFRRCVGRAVDAHGGVIDKFIGDSALIIFGVPASKPDDARRAIDCAHAILANLAAWNAERAQALQTPVAIGIGAHWGEAFCGAVGDDSRLEFTVLGDTVNVAARIEQAAKTADCQLLISDDLLTAAGGDVGTWRRLPPQALRGRSQPVTLFALNA